LEKAKPFEISKRLIWGAYRRVKANHGAAGIDKVSIEEFDRDLKNNLYKLWNRMASGSYFPPPVKAVPIPKKSGGMRILGVPTVADRIAQTAVRDIIEPKIDPCFHPDSYGYRPGKSAHQALEVTRKRCWRYDWVLEFDIRGLFDNIDHSLLMKAVRFHTDISWVLVYIERWLTAPLQSENQIKIREKGTPQGGVISPLLANLFLHYTFDAWMGRIFPGNPWARYADDGLVHCRTKEEAEKILDALRRRMAECKLELHPTKTRIVYCKDDDRKGEFPGTSFDFLGYSFQPRRAKNRWGKFFVSFLPAISNESAKEVRRIIHDWRLHLKPDKSIRDLSNMFNAVIRGWIGYYGRFYQSRMYFPLRHLNHALVYWVRKKYKRLRRGTRRAETWLGNVARREPALFAHWKLGILPSVG
jgi:RNA-directed DNA polymerase